MPSRRAAARRRWRRFALTAIGALAVDQLAKVLVRAEIRRGERIDLVPGVDLVRTTNRGIAFGFLPGSRGIVVALTVVALVIIAAVLLRLAGRNTRVAVGGGMLLGGSVGNLLDRLARDGVTDFIDLPWWPAFNLADVAIVAGAAVVALGLVGRAAGDGG